AAGKAPQPVPGRLLLPILEKGSLEEDGDLQQRWAALLANSAAQPENVLPAFVSILAELSPVEAALLERLRRATAGNAFKGFSPETYRDLQERRWAILSAQGEATNAEVLMNQIQLDERKMGAVIANLERLA